MAQIPSAESSVEKIVDIMHSVAQSYVPRSAFIGIVKNLHLILLLKQIILS